MRIDCPRCHAGYDLPPEQVPPGRTVRCVRCAELWTPVPLPPLPMPAEPPGLPAAMPTVPDSMAPSVAPRQPMVKKSTLQRIQLPGAWLLTVLVLAGLLWAAVARRAEIMHAWPPSERVYIALGLAPAS